MKIYLVRHGQTTWNLEGRLQGVSDSKLSTKGIQQAILLGTWAAGISCSNVITSDLVRAFETAKAISKLAEAPLIPTRLLRERDLFGLEGLSYSELASIRGSTDSGKNLTVDWGWCPYIEQDQSIAHRVMHVLDQLTSEGRSVLVTHAGVITAFLRTYAILLEDQNLHLPTGSVCEYDSLDRTFQIIEMQESEL